VTESLSVPPSVVVNTNRATRRLVGIWASLSSDGALDGAEHGSLDTVPRRARPGGMLHHKIVPLGALPSAGRMTAVGASVTGLTWGSMMERVAASAGAGRVGGGEEILGSTSSGQDGGGGSVPSSSRTASWPHAGTCEPPGGGSCRHTGTTWTGWSAEIGQPSGAYLTTWSDHLECPGDSPTPASHLQVARAATLEPPHRRSGVPA